MFPKRLFDGCEKMLPEVFGDVSANPLNKLAVFELRKRLPVVGAVVENKLLAAD